MGYSVSGFPTIKFFPKGSTEAEQYSVDFLNRKCGTARQSGGGLNDQAGVIDYLSSYVKEFVAGDAGSRATILQTTIDSTKDEAPENKKCADYYPKVMAKIIAQGDQYPATELNRLNRMDSSKMKDDMKDFLLKRKNILHQFKLASEQ